MCHVQGLKLSRNKINMKTTMRPSFRSLLELVGRRLSILKQTLTDLLPSKIYIAVMVCVPQQKFFTKINRFYFNLYHNIKYVS